MAAVFRTRLQVGLRLQKPDFVRYQRAEAIRTGTASGKGFAQITTDMGTASNTSQRGYKFTVAQLHAGRCNRKIAVPTSEFPERDTYADRRGWQAYFRQQLV